MVFELRIKFTGDEGDEVTVEDLASEITSMIMMQTNVKVKSAQLLVCDQIRECQRRSHASSN